MLHAIPPILTGSRLRQGRRGLGASLLALIAASGAFLSVHPLRSQPLGLEFGQSANGDTIITHIPSDSTAATAGLRDGDRVIEIGDDKMPTPDSATASIRNARAAGRSAIDLVVSRAGRLFYVALLLRH